MLTSFLCFYVFQPSNEVLLAFAQGRLQNCQSRLQLKYSYLNSTYLPHPVGSALEDANIELVAYGKRRSVMD